MTDRPKQTNLIQTHTHIQAQPHSNSIQTQRHTRRHRRQRQTEAHIIYMFTSDTFKRDLSYCRCFRRRFHKWLPLSLLFVLYHFLFTSICVCALGFLFLCGVAYNNESCKSWKPNIRHIQVSRKHIYRTLLQ